MILRHIGCAMVLAGLVCGQEPAFDSVSVKVVDPPMRAVTGTSVPGSFHLAAASMGDLIRRAYGLKMDQLSAPCWVLSVKRCSDEWVAYEVNATMPGDTSESRLAEMLRQMLAARFHLAVHHQTRNVPGYELVAEGGGVSPLHPVAPAGDQAWFANTPRFEGLEMSGMSGDSERARYRERSMGEFAAKLEPMVGMALGMDPEKVGRPRVVDRTGLEGKYSFTFGFACPCFETVGYQFPGGLSNDPVGVALPNIFDAVREQLGLRLVKTADVPVDVVVVDRVDRKPAE